MLSWIRGIAISPSWMDYSSNVLWRR